VTGEDCKLVIQVDLRATENYLASPRKAHPLRREVDYGGVGSGVKKDMSPGSLASFSRISRQFSYESAPVPHSAVLGAVRPFNDIGLDRLQLKLEFIQ